MKEGFIRVLRAIVWKPAKYQINYYDVQGRYLLTSTIVTSTINKAHRHAEAEIKNQLDDSVSKIAYYKIKVAWREEMNLKRYKILELFLDILFLPFELITLILNLASMLLEFLSTTINDGKNWAVFGILKIATKAFKWDEAAKKQLEPRLMERKDSD